MLEEKVSQFVSDIAVTYPRYILNQGGACGLNNHMQLAPAGKLIMHFINGSIAWMREPLCPMKQIRSSLPIKVVNTL